MTTKQMEGARQDILAQAAKDVTAQIQLVCAVYARKSDKDAISVAQQIQECKDFIAKKGWGVGPIFSDDGRSGAKSNRPGLNAFMAEVARTPKAFGAVVMMNVDRLSRGTIASSLTYQHEIVQSVELWYYQSGGTRVLLDTAIQELTACIGAFGARDYRDQVTEKTTNKLRQKAEQGYAVGAAAFGYKLIHQGVGLGKCGLDLHTHVTREIVPEQAAVMVRIFTMIADGYGYRKTANTLNSEHVLAPSPRGWSKDSVRRCVENPIYVGRPKWGTTQVEVPELRIISDDLQARAQARVEQTWSAHLTNERGQLLSKPESGLASKYALSGVGRCWKCGAGLKAYPATAKDVARYRCSERARRGATACQNTAGIRVSDLDLAVVEAIHNTLRQDPEAVADLLAERDRSIQIEQESRGDVRALALAKVPGIEKQIKNLLGYMKEGTASPDVVAEIASLRAEVKALYATPEGPKPFERAAFTAALKQIFGAKTYGMMALRSPQATRAAMRKLGIDRLTPRPDGQGGWTFETMADLTSVAVEERAG